MAFDVQPAEGLMFLAFLESKKADKGAEWCRKHGVGAIRREIDRSLTVVPIIGGAAPEAVETRRRAAVALSATCRACGGCELAKR